MNKLFDLRFVIGLFFLVVGILLIIYTMLSVGMSDSVNLVCGVLYLLFGLFMLFLSTKKNKSV